MSELPTTRQQGVWNPIATYQRESGSKRYYTREREAETETRQVNVTSPGYLVQPQGTRAWELHAQVCGSPEFKLKLKLPGVQLGCNWGATGPKTGVGGDWRAGGVEPSLAGRWLCLRRQGSLLLPFPLGTSPGIDNGL